MNRLDAELVARGLVDSRAHAQRVMKESRVQQNLAGIWQTVTKPSAKTAPETQLRVIASDDDRYVSRGGLKLAGALHKSGLSVKGLTALDVGQSTGGFSDCLLQAGVEKIVGVDVGHDQLAKKIREDKRVSYYEGINARELPLDLRENHAPGGFDIAVMDVSFISQTLILPSLVPLLKNGGVLLSLVKPQFEVGREGIGKGGIVRDQGYYKKVEEKLSLCCRELGLNVIDYFDSPITGGDGNREFFILAENNIDI
ncbi:TlyA family RNA methyltransferase [Gilvimarinus sp. DA14]|uniref:TlyA family RNA methyltransferase n=1 Tax=Gilvimarinus sp. DA14 TaxID=2956798 RepID=UPI0020B6C860|nr:TlyA family RNA methyltransferase [Gilvimarinus sp. DA14]UTF59040.1 TlyA family RNA methyltransferase [Gilvimarinus sp. DA14]